jgi:hypothetical protein
MKTFVQFGQDHSRLNRYRLSVCTHFQKLTIISQVDQYVVGYGHCGDVGHRHEVDDDAYACPWWPAIDPPELYCCYVREVLLEPGQLPLQGLAVPAPPAGGR